MGESKCLPKTCLATAVGYMQKTDMVRNFEAKKKRLEKKKIAEAGNKTLTPLILL